jgi:F0F1-type ATP synthase membrane subunit b/b'
MPQVQDLPVAEHGYDRAKVEESFEAFRRHVTSLQAQLRVMQAAPRGAASEPTGHAVRMDALHLVRAAAEFADTIERDAQEAASRQIARAEQEIRERHMSVQQNEAEVQRIRQETERQRVEVVNAARVEAREILAKANRDSSQELREAEASGARLLEQSRHQATELTNAARAEVEQTLEWARAQAEVIIQRARLGAEQLLGAAGHGDPAIAEAVEAIVSSAQAGAQPLGAGETGGPSAAPTEPSAAAPTMHERWTPSPAPRREEPVAEQEPAPSVEEPEKPEDEGSSEQPAAGQGDESPQSP